MELRCGCKIDGKPGTHILAPCTAHFEWMKALVHAEREECAKIADMHAKGLDPRTWLCEEEAQQIAKDIRERKG
jgi:hypothetical protein